MSLLIDNGGDQKTKRVSCTYHRTYSRQIQARLFDFINGSLNNVGQGHLLPRGSSLVTKELLQGSILDEEEDRIE